VKVWDASAVVPLVVTEASTRGLQALAVKDSGMLVWWASELECVSALARLERDDALTDHDIARALALLAALARSWHEIDPSDAIRATAVRFLRVHPLRAADALQLAAAFSASEQRPASLEIVTLDDRLGSAARKEGFTVLQIMPAG
jgi:uncharacterized protein